MWWWGGVALTKRVGEQSPSSKASHELSGVAEQAAAPLQLRAITLPLLCSEVEALQPWQIESVGSKKGFVSSSASRCTSLSLTQHHPEVFSVTWQCWLAKCPSQPTNTLLLLRALFSLCCDFTWQNLCPWLCVPRQGLQIQVGVLGPLGKAPWGCLRSP